MQRGRSRSVLPLARKRRFNSRSKSVPKRLNNVIKKVRRMAHADPVFTGDKTTIAVTSLVHSTPQIFLLNGIQQGDTQLTRDGIKVNWKSLKITLLFASGSAMVTPTNFRWIIVREETALGSAVGPTQLFNDATPDVLSQYNFTNRNIPQRYKVYYDSGIQTIANFVTDYTSVTGCGGGNFKSIRTYTKKIKFNFITDYSRGNAGTVADIDTNSLSLMVFTDTTTANALSFFGSWTLYGHDK